MKILYGVSTDGNGHMARAEALIAKLKERNASVTAIFSGSVKDVKFDKELIGTPIIRPGFMRVQGAQGVDISKTIAANIRQLPKLLSDIHALDLGQYDLVISDFEPISAWSRRFQNVFTKMHKPSIGIAHQYALEHSPAHSYLHPMRHVHNLARAKTRLGVNFHHNGQKGILPPFIDGGDDYDGALMDNKILVYLPFDDVDDVVAFLSPYRDYEFHIYSKQVRETYCDDHLSLYPVSREGFKQDFRDCVGVISAGGFMLPAEALHAGKKLLLKPHIGHPGQHADALFLEKLGAARVMTSFDHDALEGFLEQESVKKMRYPEVTEALADWIMQGDYCNDSRDELCDNLWRGVELSS